MTLTKDQSRVLEAILQPDGESVKKVDPIQLEGHGTASQEVRVAKIAKPAAEHSKAVKADVAEQSVTVRTAEDAVDEAS